MKYLEDKRVCERCGHKLHEREYLMSRQAQQNVLSLNQIAWIVVAALLMSALLSHLN